VQNARDDGQCTLTSTHSMQHGDRLTDRQMDRASGSSVVVVTLFADVPMLTDVLPAPRTTGVIPLSVEMLSDSDDEEDRKPLARPFTHPVVGKSPQLTPGTPVSGGGAGESKLLLLKIASEFVEAAAAAASSTQGQSLFYR